MKVKANHWLKTETGWHKAGDVFEVKSLDGLTGMVEVVEEPKCKAPAPAPVTEEAEDTQAPKPTKRARKRSAE